MTDGELIIEGLKLLKSDLANRILKKQEEIKIIEQKEKNIDNAFQKTPETEEDKVIQDGLLLLLDKLENEKEDKVSEISCFQNDSERISVLIEERQKGRETKVNEIYKIGFYEEKDLGFTKPVRIKIEQIDEIVKNWSDVLFVAYRECYRKDKEMFENYVNTESFLTKPRSSKGVNENHLIPLEIDGYEFFTARRDVTDTFKTIKRLFSTFKFDTNGFEVEYKKQRN